MDWLGVLDFDRALVNCHTDMIGDWYRDPWGWPEIDWVVEKRSDLLAARLNARGVRRVARLDVPKENFATRPAVVMDPLDRLIYQALVDRISVRLIGDLRTWVSGWRMPRDKPQDGRYVSNGSEWKWYRYRLKSLSRKYGIALATDVVSYFASISIDRLADDIQARVTGDVPTRLMDMLTGWSKVPGRPGLPQRSHASAALANLYLKPLDDAIDSASPKPTKTFRRQGAARWMDDIWIFGVDAGELRGAQLTLESALRDLGLNMNVAKTKILEGDALVNAALEIEHSAVDFALDSEHSTDARPLEELIAKLINEPEGASRTSIRFVTTRMRGHALWDHVRDFVDVAGRMPHGADALGRLFRDGGAWRDLERWYVDYCRSAWGKIPWSKAQLGTMFPSNDGGTGVVRGYLSEVLLNNAPLPLAALAAQRLTAWKPDDARQVIREASKKSEHPLERRVLALAALEAKEERAFIRSILREFEENEVTLAMIEARRFNALPVKGDFA